MQSPEKGLIMQARRYRHWLAAAALAIAPVLGAQVARGQYAASSGGGHALDANNQVGSGGFNGNSNNSSLITGNDIVYNHVTGGRGLTGSLREIDPLAFRGILPGTGIDDFVSGSNGAPTAYSPSFSLNQPRPFYGDSRGVAPPVGTVLLGSSGAAIGTSLTPTNPYSAAAVASSDDLAGVRTGTTNVLGIPGGSTNSLLALPGAQGSSYANMQSVLAASPLYGVKYSSEINAAAVNDSINNPTPGGVAPSSIDANTLNTIRQQLQTSPSNSSQPNQNLNGENPNATNGPKGTNGNTNSNNGNVSNPYNPSSGNPLLNTSPSDKINGSVNGAALEMPLNSAVGSGPLNDAAGTTPFGTYRESPNGIQLVSPSAYSKQYGDMQKQLALYNPLRPGATGKKPTATPTTRPSNPFLPPTPGAKPGAAPNGPNGEPLAVPGGTSAEPVKVSSIADTVTSPKAKGLHDLLAKAEDALKHDQFKAAIDEFNAAMFVAPNNQMIALGRANADLAAGYYATAEQTIRRAASTDAAVLMAQLDLNSMLSSQRLDYIKKDLKDLADKNPRESRPWFLLAYIAYNTGDEQTAANDLAEAKKRSGVLDVTIPLMQRYWQLPAADTVGQKQELNK
jgi:hypothetical protein